MGNCPGGSSEVRYETHDLGIEMKNLRRPLVTGGGGFVGSHLVHALSQLTDVDEVYCVDLPKSPRFHFLSSLPKVKIIEVNLANEKDLGALPNDVTMVFALAAKNGTSKFYSSPFTVLENSSFPTLITLKKYARTTPIVYTSSSETYAATISDGQGSIPTTEEVRTSIGDYRNPRWSYALGKLYGEIALSAACQEFGASGTILRYHNLYGPDMGPGHFVSDFVSRAHLEDFSIQGGDSTRSFLYISEAIEATILASQHTSSSLQIYNVGSEEELSITDAAREILNQMGHQGRSLISTPEPAGSVYRRCPDISKIRTDMGWHPRISFEEGIGYYLKSVANG